MSPGPGAGLVLQPHLVTHLQVEQRLSSTVVARYTEVKSVILMGDLVVRESYELVIILSYFASPCSSSVHSRSS